MLALISLIFLATVSFQAPIETDSLNDTPNLDTTLSPAGVVSNATDLIGFSPGYESNMDFGCYQHFHHPSFEVDRCRIDIANGMSLADLEKPRVWGNWPGGIHTPQEWYSGSPRKSPCTLKIFATERSQRGSKPAEFSFWDIERLENKIVSACRYYDGGREHTTGGYARMYMATEHGRIKTVYEVALYANTRGPGLLGPSNITAAIGSPDDAWEDAASPIQNVTLTTDNIQTPTASNIQASSDGFASA